MGNYKQINSQTPKKLLIVGAYKTHIFQCKLELGQHDEIPAEYEKHVMVEYNMPNSTVSRAQIRSISVENRT